VTLKCKSSTKPSWTKEGDEGITKKHSLLYFDLLLTNVTEEDTGKYYCFGTTELRKKFMVSVDVLVGGMFPFILYYYNHQISLVYVHTVGL